MTEGEDVEFDLPKEGSAEFIKDSEEQGAFKQNDQVGSGFKLKSKRESPWFFNAGEYAKDGKGLHILGNALAKEVINSG